MRERLNFWCFFVLPFVLAVALPACAASDKATIYTEEGLRAAEQGWDGYYNSEGDRCERLHEPKTPGMEECFGDTYDADAAVALVVQNAVALLQTYWRARAAGDKPDLMSILKEVQTLIDDLPPEAKKYFDRVRGLP